MHLNCLLDLNFAADLDLADLVRTYGLLLVAAILVALVDLGTACCRTHALVDSSDDGRSYDVSKN